MTETLPFIYRKELPDGMVLTSANPSHAEALENLQRIVFPTLADSSIIRKEHYLDYIRVFPEGQFVVMVGAQLVGMTTSIRHHLLLGEVHTFNEMLHRSVDEINEPEGEWLYGLDIGTHPDFRGKGIASYLYDARQETVERLNLKGQFTYGMLNGLGARLQEVSAEAYYQQVVTKKIKDPTVSRQMKNGFVPHALVHGYVDDPQCAGYCAFLIRKNENYQKK
ncbi:MAG: GNAT family N-acetyltransferase [Flammeovirgaceae bacterium]